MRNPITMYVCVFMIFFGPAASADPPSDHAMSLNRALARAYESNPDLRAAREEIKAAKGRWIQAEAPPGPEGEIEIGGLKKNDKGKRKGEIGSFAIKQPLDPPGTRFLRGSIAKDEVEIAEGRLEILWGEVRREVIHLYAAIRSEEKAVEISGENLDTTRQFFARVEAQFQSGSALQSDVVRAKIEVSRAESALLVSQKNLKVSRGKLNLLLGREVDRALELSDGLAYEELRYEYETVRRQALNRRADIANEKTRLGARKKGVWSAILGVFFPEMAVGIERTTEEYENDTALVLEGSYPLWGFNLGEVKEAKAEKNKQAIKLEALKRRVGLEVYEAFLEAELADKQVNIQRKALDEANELLRQITMQYEEGRVPFLSYLEHIKTIKETRLDYCEVLENYSDRVAELERVIQETPIPGGIAA